MGFLLFPSPITRDHGDSGDHGDFLTFGDFAVAFRSAFEKKKIIADSLATILF
jgi:hypothetical protein